MCDVFVSSWESDILLCLRIVCVYFDFLSIVSQSISVVLFLFFRWSWSFQAKILIDGSTFELAKNFGMWGFLGVLVSSSGHLVLSCSQGSFFSNFLWFIDACLDFFLWFPSVLFLFIFFWLCQESTWRP